jgi:hypothetical protein
MPLNTKHLFLISPELGNQFDFNLDLDRPPRRHAHVPRVAAITIAC